MVKDKLGNDVNPLKMVLFGIFVLILIIGLLAVFVLHSHLLAFICLPLVFIIFIMFAVLQIKDVKSGKYQNKMNKLLQNTKDKYDRRGKK